jgi:hypothetical protein
MEVEVAEIEEVGADGGVTVSVALWMPSEPPEPCAVHE